MVTRAGGDYIADIQILLNTDNLMRGINMVGREMSGAERSTDSLRRSVDRLDAAASDTSGLTRTTREVSDLGRETTETRGKLDALATGLAALTGGIAVGGLLAGAQNRLREIRDIQRELGGGTAQDAQRLISAAGSTGLDAGAIGGALYDATERAQTGLADPGAAIRTDFAALGVDFQTFATGLLAAGDAGERVAFILQTLQSVPIDRRLAFLEVAAGGSAQSLNLLANDAQLAAQFLGDFGNALTQTDGELARLSASQSAMQDLSDSVSVLAGTFATALAPAVDLLAGAVSPISSAFAWLNENVPALSTVISVGLVGAIGAATLAMTGLGGAIAGVTVAIATNPVGLALVGITLAVVGLAAGINALANHVGGFGNLWASAWDGIVAAAVTAIDLILLPLRVLIATLNAVSSGLSSITAGRINLGRIDDPTERLREVRGERLASIDERLTEARREREAEARAEARQNRPISVTVNQSNDISESLDATELADLIANRTAATTERAAVKAAGR